MDDIFFFLGPVLLVGGLGWVLGVVGFVRAGRALARVRALERLLFAGAVAPRAEMPAASVPDPAPDAAFDDAREPVMADVGIAAEAPLPGPVTDEVAPKRDLEALLTLRWGVWLGAAALVLAGVFLIRYAVDAGLLGPGVRCVLAALLGAVLVAGGEAVLRRAGGAGLRGDQVPAALSAGGIAVLFGAAYGAGPLYRLVPDLLGFALLAGVGLGGLVLSLRQGRLVAAVGLVGAFVTPLLVAGDASLGRLFFYLLVVTAAALGVVRLTAWSWLGWAAIAAGALYVLLALPHLGAGQAWAPAGFVAVAAALNVGLLPGAALETVVGRRLAWVPFAVLGVCGLLICAAVDDWPAYAGVLLLASVAIAKGAWEPRLDRLPWLAALVCLVLLRLIVLPPWHATGEAITIEGRVVGMLPGALVPAGIVKLLWVAALVAGVFGLAGLWLERRAPQPERWSALTAAVPVLCLALTFAQVGSFQSDGVWAAEAGLLAAGLVGAAAVAGDRARAAVHAAGAVAALALGCAMLLSDYWLTLALALFLPGLAWVEAEAKLPALRKVAVVVGLVVLARLLLNFSVLHYAFGTAPVANGLLAAYGVPAVAFAAAAVMFQRGGADMTVAVLQAGAVALATVFVAAEIHHAANGGRLDHPDLSFLEAGLQVDALGILALAVIWITRTTPSPVLRVAWEALGWLGLSGGVALLMANPAVTGASVGTLPVLDDLLAAYLVPALLATVAARQPQVGRNGARWLGAYAVVAIFGWLTLEIRHLFHPGGMRLGLGPAVHAELWAYSAAWLSLGALLLAWGIRLGSRPLRLAALAIIGIATAKVFLVDMGGLVGLWRVLSFLGLGLALIGLGAVYRRFVVMPVKPS